jgi:hypothetical protein
MTWLADTRLPDGLPASAGVATKVRLRMHIADEQMKATLRVLVDMVRSDLAFGVRDGSASWVASDSTLGAMNARCCRASDIRWIFFRRLAHALRGSRPTRHATPVSVTPPGTASGDQRQRRDDQEHGDGHSGADEHPSKRLRPALAGSKPHRRWRERRQGGRRGQLKDGWCGVDDDHDALPEWCDRHCGDRRVSADGELSRRRQSRESGSLLDPHLVEEGTEVIGGKVLVCPC